MGNVVDLPVITTLDLDPDRLLQKAIGELESVILIGYRKDGSEYFASSKADAGDAIFHMERAKHKLMLLCDEG